MKKNTGSSMLAVLMVLGTLSACVIAALNYTSVVSRDVQRSNTRRAAIEIGDGVLDYAFTHWRAICRVKDNAPFSTNNFASIPLPTSALFPSVPAFSAVSTKFAYPAVPTATVSNFKVVATDQFGKPLTSTSTAPPPATGMSLGTSTFTYLATADVTLPAVAGKPVTVRMCRNFTKSLLSPWNYAIFYVDDLEIHPGATQSVTGWVHTNTKLYTAHNTLTFQSKVSYADDWSKNFKPGDDRYGNETPTAPNTQSNLPPFRDQGQQPFGLDSTLIFSTSDSNANNDSYRELVEVPSGSGTDPISDARYYNQAGIKILVNSAGAVTYRRLDGTVISSTSTGNDLKLYNAFSGAISVGATITDKRESTTVRLVDVNVATIRTKLTESGAPPFNGVVYISDQSATATAKRAVRLKNGASLPPGGLTFATDNGLYIQGDFNTGRTGSTEPPSNYTSSADPTKPTVTGYTRQSCAVLADAVMILSNNWSDSNSSSALSSRVATNTTVNCAIVSGIVPTASGNYSGGAENFPRFLETWSGDTFTYYGSMVELYPSKQFNTPWKNTGSGPNVYDPPTRRWYFDTNFYTTPPPGTLTLVAYSKDRWYIE